MSAVRDDRQAGSGDAAVGGRQRQRVQYTGGIAEAPLEGRGAREGRALLWNDRAAFGSGRARRWKSADRRAG